MILERGYTRSPHQGAYLAHLALIWYEYPDAERVLRRVLDDNPDRNARGVTCYWLAQYLSQQAKIVRALREDPAKMKDYERYTASESVATLVKGKDPSLRSTGRWMRSWNGSSRSMAGWRRATCGTWRDRVR